MAESPQGAPIDRYVVLEYLAEGGMGAIYLGKKLGAGGFEKQVVLKQLLPEFTQQPEFIDLFLREARLSATLDHANIVHTIDLVSAGDEHFIVMEYLDGADLRTLLKRAKRRRARFSAAAGIYIARELLSALAYAHNKVGPDGRPLRLIHRDISPSNILVSGNGEVKLTDFGIAKAATHNSVFYRVKGKIGYMSPEQARSDTLDARSDLYSLAVCLYEVITGERLFVSAGLTTSAEEMYQQPVPLVSKKVPGLPSELDKVMLRALAVDPDHRYQTAGELQEALLRCAHRHGLMMSAPELAEHMREVCGEAHTWREPERQMSAAGGTALYDDYAAPEGTEQIDPGSISSLDFEDDEDYDVVAVGGALVSSQGKRRSRQRSAMTHLTALQGVELTSLINFTTGPEEGAQPLAEFETFQRLADSALPRGESSAPRIDPSPGKIEIAPRQQRLETEFTGEVIVPGSGRVESAGDARSAVPAPARGAPARRPLLALGLIVLLGIATAAAIGLSGPSLDATLPDLPADAPSAADARNAASAGAAEPASE